MHARLKEIADSLDELSWSLNNRYLGELAEEVAEIAKEVEA